MQTTSPSFPSRVALEPGARGRLIDTLNVALATGIDLTMQVKQAHWNIKGPQFFARHELFDKLAKRLRKITDELAERAATLGGYAKGTVRLSSSLSTLPEYDLAASDGRQHVKVLVDRFAAFAELLRVATREAEKLEDAATVDLYAGALRGVELDLWFLESHLHS